eukprot:TRINITY_DN93152_c0_g1_i1.p1 TRINITY_DN93152_c0_g1~~TRINITY_DN93152_c0_g1_i1.p1  ORF type:complete len:302 (+),score=39.47 TRINITY_DN93152_c0_g1_i1:33-908(+)
MKSEESVNSTPYFDDKGDAELSKVAFSSRWVAAERAMESARQDALFHDPFAEALGGESGRKMSIDVEPTMAGLAGGWAEWHRTWVAVRTRAIDDRVADFARTTGGRFQLVNVGAGLDTRAMRLESLRGCRACFEVDVPEVNTAKETAFCALNASALCPRISVSADLCTEGLLSRALLAAGLDKTCPTFWLIEGVTMYLQPSVNISVFTQMRALSCAGSFLCCGFIGDPSKLPPGGMPFWKPPEDFCKLMEELRWQDVRTVRYGDPELDYGRYPKDVSPDACQCMCYAHVLS